MKVSRNQIIFIIILSIILICSIVAYFITRTKDNYSITHERFSNKLTIKDLISQGKLNSNGTFKFLTRAQIQEAKMKRKVFVNKLLSASKVIKFKQQYFTNLLKNRPKLPKFQVLGGRTPGQKNTKPISENFLKPDATEEKMKDARADKKIDDYLTAIDDAQSSAVAGILTSLYGAFQCDMSDDPHCVGPALRDLALQVGLGLLKIGLACAGLGFINSGLDAIFGGALGPPPIDYDRITQIVTDAVQKQAIITFVTDMNVQLANVKSFIETYTSAKSTFAQASCNNSETPEDLISCMKKPNFNYPSLKFDPSLIIQNTGTLDGLTNKREFLKNLLKSGPLWNMINSVDKYGVNGIIKYSQINAFASTQLYSTFKLLIGFYIVYYQEMAMIDQSTPGEGNIKYNNPWMSSYIGDPGKIGKKQPLGSLLGDLQDLCQKLFDYLKYTYLQYWRSLSWTDHSDCCDWYCPGSCVRWSRMEDKSNCYDQNWWDLINEKHPNTNNGPKWSAYMDNLYKTEENKTGTYNWFIYIFDDYMNFPFTQLQVLKKMAGIDYLIGEQNFYFTDYCRNQTYDTNKNTIYSAYGGYPYGSSKMSYKEAQDAFINPNSYNKNVWSNLGSSYCTPLITTEIKDSDCGNGFSQNKPFDATIFNLPGDPRTYTNNMYCQPEQSAISCVRPGRSPGTNTGVIEPNSRTAFCVNTNNDETSDLLEVDDKFVGKCITSEISWAFIYAKENNTYYLQVVRSYIPGSVYNKELPEFAYKGKYYALKINNAGTDVFDITEYISLLIESYKTNLNIDLPPVTGKVMLNLSLSKIPEDLGYVNNTTRPPINLESSITGYPIDIISSVNRDSNWISMSLKIYKN